jgi:hypothetical protein
MPCLKTRFILFSWASSFVTMVHRLLSDYLPTPVLRASNSSNWGVQYGNEQGQWCEWLNVSDLYWKRQTKWLGNSQKRPSQRRTARTENFGSEFDADAHPSNVASADRKPKSFGLDLYSLFRWSTPFVSEFLVEVHYLALATISNFSDQTSALLTEVFTEVFQEKWLAIRTKYQISWCHDFSKNLIWDNYVGSVIVLRAPPSSDC